MGLNENMRTAVEAAGAVRLKIPRSANYEFTSSAIKQNGKPLPLHTVSWKELNAMRSSVGGPASNDQKGFVDWAKKVDKQAGKKKMGNCGEIALVAIHHMYGKGIRNLDYVYVVDGVSMNAVVPHVIAVLGRAGNSTGDIGLPDTWGKDAVVCDAWDRVVYPASDYASYWDGLKKNSDRPATLTCDLVHRFT